MTSITVLQITQRGENPGIIPATFGLDITGTLTTDDIVTGPQNTITNARAAYPNIRFISNIPALYKGAFQGFNSVMDRVTADIITNFVTTGVAQTTLTAQTFLCL